MKLWLISQNKNDGYDTFDSAVVAAETATDAQCIHPHGYIYYLWPTEEEKRHGWCEGGDDNSYGVWADHPSEVTAEYLGESDDDEEGVSTDAAGEPDLRHRMR